MRRFLTTILLILAFLGIADSAYLANAALTGSPLTCNIAGLSGCNVVAQSNYSHLFGIPFGVYGVLFYGIVFILGAFLLAKHSHRAHQIAAFLGWIGLLASIVFVSIQEFLIKALCVYCLGSALLALLICIIATVLWRRFTPPDTEPAPQAPASPAAPSA